MGKWGTDYTTDRVHRPVEVPWKVESDRLQVLEKRTLIEELGWEILEEEAERANPLLFRSLSHPPLEVEDEPNPTIRLTMRRRELIGPVIAANPSLH